MTARQPRAEPLYELQVFASLIIAVPVAGLVFGGFLQWTGRMASVGALYGVEGMIGAWGFHFVHVTVAGLGFVLLTTILSPDRVASSFGLEGSHWTVLASTVFGIVYGAVLWVALVVIGLPIWMDLVLGAQRPFPYLHWVSLVGLTAFGACFGACFTGVLEYAAVTADDYRERRERGGDETEPIQ